MIINALSIYFNKLIVPNYMRKRMDFVKLLTNADDVVFPMRCLVAVTFKLSRPLSGVFRVP